MLFAGNAASRRYSLKPIQLLSLALAYNVKEFLPHAFEKLLSAHINDISDEECRAISQGTSRCAPSGYCIGSATLVRAGTCTKRKR
ncbi:hypothetical protein BDR04DRAFT_1092649, partial [Suillus decipiens]